MAELGNTWINNSSVETDNINIRSIRSSSIAIIKLSKVEKDAIAMNNIKLILILNMLLLLFFVISTYFLIWYEKNGNGNEYKCWINLYFFDSESNIDADLGSNADTEQLLIFSIKDNCSNVNQDIIDCDIECNELREITIVQTISAGIFALAVLLNIFYIYQLTGIIKKIKAGVLMNKCCGPNTNQKIIFVLYLSSSIISGAYLGIIKSLQPDCKTIAAYGGILILCFFIMVRFRLVYKSTIERDMVNRLLEAENAQY